MSGHTPVIVITGGPNGGKTTILEQRLPAELKRLGYTVEVIPEAATQLINEGRGPAVVGMETFQRLVLRRCMEQEDAAKARMRRVIGKKVILADRGIMDGAAYVEPEIMKSIWEEHGYHPIELRDLRYHGVVHLVTTAIGLPHLFSNATNPARYERSAEEAAAVDERTLAAWIGCPHLAYIDNSTDFETKVQRALTWVKSLLDDFEHERKFKLLIPFTPDLLPAHAQRVDISQSYIKVPRETKGERVRARGQSGKSIHFRTMKTGHNDITNNETEALIGEKKYHRLRTKHRLPTHAEVVKDRWCFVECGHYWELDVFRDWHEVIIEVELPDPSWEVTLPAWMESNVEEVTGNPEYTNKRIARKIELNQAA